MASLQAELEGLAYRELQHRAKEAGVKATGKAEELVQRILEADANGGPPPSTAMKRGSGAAAKTPRTSRRGAATVDKAALLRAAASTPLPTEQREGARSEAEEEEEEPRRSSGRGVRRRLSSQSQQRGKSPATPRAGAKQPAAVAGIATPLFWLVLLTALAAGLAALAVPYCQQQDCAVLARRLPQAATEAAAGLYAQGRARVQGLAVPDAAAEAYAQARAWALAAADAAQAQWRLLLEAARPGSSGGAPGCRFDASAVLKSIMPVGPEYDALRGAAAAALASGGAEPDKAAAALLVCEAPDDCHSALRLLEEAAAAPAACLLSLDAAQLGSDRGALQAQLAAFLSNAPQGLVLIHRIDQMSPELLPVLINALSEGGAFQQGGEAVGTTRASFLLTSLMPDEVFVYLADEVRFRQEAKTRLVVDLALRAADKDTAKSQAGALRRRIDFVIPIGSDPALAEPAAAQWEAGGCGLAFDRLAQAVLPAGDDWAPLREGAIAAMQRNAATKPPVALFACDDEEACLAAATEAKQAATGSPRCLLELEGRQLGGATALQADLVAFIRQVPAGTVLIKHIDQMDPDVLGVLVEGLGPGATLAAPDGTGSVSTLGTTFLLTSRMPGEVFAGMASEQRFHQDAHLQMVADFRARAANKPAAAILAEALAQRIDATLPVGSDPARFAAWQAAHPGGEQEQPAEEADVAQWETEPAPEAAAEAAEATEAAAEAAE